MALSFEVPTPLSYFAALVQSDSEFPLLEAAVSLGQDEEPALDVQQVLDQVDQLQARLRRRLPTGVDPMLRLRALCQMFFGDLGFAGNRNNYYDPDNSYMHRVLVTRRGIPISLAVLWLELAQGAGLSAAGVGFPGHFLVRVRMADGLVVIDPFTGDSLSRSDLAARLEPYWPEQHGTPDPERDIDAFLRPSTPREIIARMLRNLKDIHHSQHDLPRLLAVQERMVTLLPHAWEERRDRGLTLAELGDHERASVDLERYLHEVRGAPDVPVIAARLHDLRRA